MYHADFLFSRNYTSSLIISAENDKNIDIIFNFIVFHSP
jgi:hypothetical protein